VQENTFNTATWQGGCAHIHGKYDQGGRKGNGCRLCSRHFKHYDKARTRLRINDAEILASIRNNGDAASAENVYNRINNNDNCHVADDHQPVGILPDGHQRLLPRPHPTRRPQTLSEQQSAAREEPGIIVSKNRSQNNVPVILLLVTSSLKLQTIMSSCLM
jgi:hypothetical protein